MRIAVRGGHNFQATGAVGLLDEVVEDRKVKDALIKYLKQLGHEVLDVTPGNMDSDSDLAYGVSKANTWGADLFISIHFNKAYDSYNGAIGTETWVYSKSDNFNDEVYAERIVNKLSGLGFKNRGVKERTDLYELKSTAMPAVIVEVCFVEATEDVALYKKHGADKIGQLIAEGIANKNIATKVHVSEYLNVKPFMEGIGIYKDDTSWEKWNRIAYLGAPISLLILDNPSKYVYKVKDFRYGYEGYAYAEDTGNYSFTTSPEYKEEKKDPLYKMLVDNIQVTDKTLAKWLPDMVKEQLEKSTSKIEIFKCN